MPQRADAGPSISVDLDIDAKYIVEVLGIVESQAQWDNAKQGDMSLTWKFRVFDTKDGYALIDNNSGDAYELWNFTNDNTYRNDTTGKAAKAREWTEALVGRTLSTDEMNELIDLGFEDCLKGKRGLADIEWYTTRTGNERLKIIRLRPYKKGQAAAAPEEPTPPSKSNSDRIAGDARAEDARKLAARRAALGLDDAA